MSRIARTVVAGATACGLTAAATMSTLMPAAAAGEGRTSVAHDVTYAEYFPDDICGPRASYVTFTATTAQQQFLQRPDGTWLYREVAVVTYTANYDDPALPDVTGRLTEVNHYNLTPGDTFLATEVLHEFFGDVKVWWKYHLTEVDGEPKVERFVVDWVGCP